MLIAIGIIALLAAVGLYLLNRVSVGKSRLMIQPEARFPVVSGFNLQREELEFPRDFGGELNLVIVPFQQRQQQDVNTWLPAAQELERRFSNFMYYELPTIYELPTLSRTFINEGMRAGIPDTNSRERTVTLYLDKESFKNALEIRSEETIYLFLVDREGEIYWRGEGLYSEQKVDSLLQVIELYQ